MEPSDVDRQAVLGVEYCTGYVDDNGQWRKGFYCPKKADGVTSTLERSKDIFCCGTQTSKFCCERKEGFSTTSTSGFYVSFSTLVSVTTVTFVLAVLLTALAFICCRKYWKERDREVEIHETHFYRMACSSSSAPLVSPPFSASFHSNAAASLTSPMNGPPEQMLEAGYSAPYALGLHRSPGGQLGGLSVIGPPGYPPPPYQSHPSLDISELAMQSSETNTNTEPSVRTTVSIVAPNKTTAHKPLWRKLSH